ncbi:MAG: T9SS type A sorting domain-containing protein [Ignavibacteriaceae bacterium]
MEIIFFTILFFTISLYAQNSRVNWSIFNSGFSYSKNVNSGIMSEAGQNFTGISKKGNNLITSGFLANYSRVLTNVNDKENSIPNKFGLSQNYPNPFNPTTRIKYEISSKEHVMLKVYDILGREVTTLVNKEQLAGKYEVTFNALNLASGIYLYVLKAGSFYMAKKLVLLK